MAVAGLDRRGRVGGSDGWMDFGELVHQCTSTACLILAFVGGR